MVDTINMSIDPLYGEGDYIEWEFFSKHYDSFFIIGSENPILYRELDNKELLELDTSFVLLHEDFFDSDESVVFHAKGVGFIRSAIEVNDEDDLVRLTKQYGYQQMFSEYNVSYPARFYQVITEKYDSECELIWIPEENIKYLMPDEAEYEVPQDLPKTISDFLFDLGDKVNWRVISNPAIMYVPLSDDDDNCASCTEVKLWDIAGIVAERIYRKYLPSVAHITNSREKSIKDQRFWNMHIPLARSQGWVYKLEIQLYGKYGDFWVCEEDLTPSLSNVRKFYDLAIVPPVFLSGIEWEEEAA